jgi:uncharacterized NAD(P)/FAD-binding protein YdhS
MLEQCTVGIIGSGATGISLANQIVRTLPLGINLNGIRIVMFEGKGAHLGGNAYANDSSTNLMNTKCGAIDRGYGEGFGILEWAKKNQHKWRELVLDKQINEDTYVPRAVVGLYLTDLFSEAKKHASERGIQLDLVPEEVLDLDPINGGYILQTSGSKSWKCKYVYLALGHLESKTQKTYQEHERYYHNPYPINQLIHEIPKNASVGVIGTRLSAIDVALGLTASEHVGPITCISRGGRLPAVRAEYGTHEFKDIKREELKSILSKSSTKLGLSDIISMLNKEIIRAEGRELNLVEVMRKDLSAMVYYENEISLSTARERPWQAALYATNSNIDLLWHHLNDSDKKLFMSTWFSDWLLYRASIPRENAERILDLLKDDRLSIEGNSSGFSYNSVKEKFEMHRTSGSPIEVDYLVCATGSTADIENTTNTLVVNLLKKGIIRPHEHGGIDCCFVTGRVVPKTPKPEGRKECNIFALGPITSGVYFFTTALEIIERHSKERVSELSFMLARDLYERPPVEDTYDNLEFTDIGELFREPGREVIRAEGRA